jgi:hypothetical protein
MSPISTAFRGLAKVADATTAAAGAVGGAAVNGVMGGLQGAANGVAHGVRSGVNSGSRSSAAAALTLGAIGAAGLVEWPLLVTVGGTVLVVHQLSRRASTDAATPPSIPSNVLADNNSEPTPIKRASRSTGTSTRKPAKTARRTTAARRTTK